jgi:elongation factor 2
MAKSPNKHNRVFCRAAPLTEALCADIEYGPAGFDTDPTARADLLVGEYNWDARDARKIWCYGPDLHGPNVLVDATRGTQYMSEMKDWFIAAWQWATREGVLCEEHLRGVRMNIEDVIWVPDAIHRGGGQIIPAARRVFNASCLTASPRVLEPVFLVDIRTPNESALEAIHDLVSRRRGIVISEEENPRSLASSKPAALYVRAHLPVAESFGFTAELNMCTLGQAIAPQWGLDHWQQFPGDPLEANSEANKLVLDIRSRKGLRPDIPQLDNFLDRL